MANMLCPKCGQFQEKADICSSCGIIVAKFKAESTQKSSDNPNTFTLGLGHGIDNFIIKNIDNFNKRFVRYTLIVGIGVIGGTFICYIFKLPLWIPITLIVSIYFFSWQLIQHFQCPQCKRKWVMTRTVANKRTWGFSFGEEYEMKCLYCGHREWVYVDND